MKITKLIPTLALTGTILANSMCLVTASATNYDKEKETYWWNSCNVNYQKGSDTTMDKVYMIEYYNIVGTEQSIQGYMNAYNCKGYEFYSSYRYGRKTHDKASGDRHHRGKDNQKWSSNWHYTISNDKKGNIKKRLEWANLHGFAYETLDEPNAVGNIFLKIKINPKM